MRRWLICAGLLLIGGLAVCPPASGHGILQGASPPPNALLPSPPARIIIVFTEAADPAFTSARVIDQHGRRVSQSSSVSGDGRRLTATLTPLSRGVYTVRWRMLSAVDGHTTTGSYRFTVTATSAGPPAGPPRPAGIPGQPAPVQPTPAPEAVPTDELTPPPLQVVLRWVSYAAALVLAGTAVFGYFVLRPALTAAEPHLAISVEDIAAPALRRLSVPAVVVLLLSLGAGLLVQMQTLFDAPLTAVIAGGEWRALLTGTRLGWSVLLQSIMTVILIIPESRRGRVFRMAAVIWAMVAGTLALLASSPGAVSASQHLLHLTVLLLIGTVYSLISVMAAIILPLIPDLRLPQAKWAAPAAAAILLLGMTLNSHATGAGWLALAADWAHLAAAATWAGGLAAMIVILRAAPAELRSGAARTLVPRFSAFTAASLFILILTGTYAAWLNLPDWRAFTVTPYGRTLLIKLLLVVPWIVLGAVNHFVLRPRLAAGANRPLLRKFVRLIGAEVAMAAAVLLAVAVLTITPPAKVTMPAGGPVIAFAGISRNTRVGLSVQLVRTRWHAYAVTLDLARQEGPAATVQLRFESLEASASPAVIPLSSSNGEYRGEGPELAGGGWWQIDVIASRGGVRDLVAGFPIYLNGEGVRESQEAGRVLAEALERSRSIRSWRQVEQITDGSGNVAVTQFAFSAPDRLRYETSSGGEAIIIGATRYVRESGSWRTERLPVSVPVGGPFVELLRGAEQAGFGRRDRCGNEPCRVVFWQFPAAQARFAAWIGERTRRIHRLLMIAPQHYMTATAFDFDVPVNIAPPK